MKTDGAIASLLSVLPDHASLYVVGGAVRDALAERPISDLDVCVTGMSVPELQQTLGAEMVNPSSGIPVFVYHHEGLKVEVTVPRIERKGNGMGNNSHKDFDFLFDGDITIEQDLSRRDLTINAMALLVKKDGTKQVIDPFNGLNDLQNKVLRHVSSHFVEDPLRVFRLYRFTCKGFSVADETKNYLVSNKTYLENEIAKMPAERISAEIIKAMAETEPGMFFETLADIKVGENVLPEIIKMASIPAGPEFDRMGNRTNHPKGETLLQHSLRVLKRVSSATEEKETRLAGFLHDFGKLFTETDILPHHYGHEERGETEVVSFLRRLKFSSEYINVCSLACGEHTKMADIAEMRPSKVIVLFESLMRKKALEDLRIIANADSSVDIDGSLFDKFVRICQTPVSDLISMDRLSKIKNQDRKAEILCRRVQLFRKTM